jgi:chaperonin GroEL
MHPDPGGADSQGTDRGRAAGQGIGVLAGLIARTLGPAGRPAVIKDPAGDDIEAPDAEAIVARFTPGDPRDRLGAGYVRDLVLDQHAAAGDGAATAVVLADAMVRRVVAAVTVNADPVGLTLGIQAALDRVLDELGSRATDVRAKEEIAGVMAAAIFDRPLADVLAEAFDKVGKEGVIIVEPAAPGAAPDPELTLSHGMTVEGGYVSADFVTDAARGEAVVLDPCLLLVDGVVAAAEDLLPALDTAAAAGRPLVVLASGVEGAALEALLASESRGTSPALAARVSGNPATRRAVLGDLAALTGATVIGATVIAGTADDPGSLGRAGKVIATGDRVFIVDAPADETAFMDRFTRIRGRIESPETAEEERQELFRRLERFAGGVATVRVGGATSAETELRIARAERGLVLARMAMDNSVVPGGGAALADIQRALEKFPKSLSGRRWGHEDKDQTIGARILLDSLTAPMRQLAENAGVPAAAIDKALKSREDGTGIDATGNTVPMRPQAMDALPVLVAAVTNAASLTKRVLAG